MDKIPYETALRVLYEELRIAKENEDSEYCYSWNWIERRIGEIETMPHTEYDNGAYLQGGTVEVTRVVFRKWKSGHDIFALMPDLAEYDGMVESYEHIGGHGSADYAGCIARSVRATPEEYSPLLQELESIGYRVRPILHR